MIALLPLGLPFLFLLLNIAVLRLVLALNRRPGAGPAPKPHRDEELAVDRILDPERILGWEFEYARITASEAMQDRHTMVNFYLLAFGVIASGVVAILAREADVPLSTGALLLWVLCAVGWLYFLKIVRLRQAWHESARAMNQIKEFYIRHARALEPGILQAAFRWQAHTLPPPEKPWTLFFYSAVLISFLDSVAFCIGAFLLAFGPDRSLAAVTAVGLVFFGLVFFTFHVWLYQAFLKTA